MKIRPIEKPVKFCAECRGEGRVLVDRPDGKGKWMELCKCRRPRPVTREIDFTQSKTAREE